ncbi:MAG TPA: hypothetical protein VJ715_19270 [Pyrinomonadaceae bacterium]|nr:hypothetical protein [Pyrinomonadaceae bacterium]
MSTRNSFSAKLLCALAALCLLASACSTKEPAVLTQPQVAELLQKWDAAQMNDDIKGVTACLSPKLRYKLTFKGFGPIETKTGDYREYIESTKIGFDAGQSLSTNRTMGAIGVQPDGQSASVIGEVHYSMTVEGRLYRTVSTGTMTVGIEDGRAVFTAIDQLVEPDYEGRPVFDTTRN